MSSPRETSRREHTTVHHGALGRILRVVNAASATPWDATRSVLDTGLRKGWWPSYQAHCRDRSGERLDAVAGTTLTGDAASTTSLFQWGCVSKLLTVMVLGVLVSKGQLEWDDRL